MGLGSQWFLLLLSILHFMPSYWRLLFIIFVTSSFCLFDFVYYYPLLSSLIIQFLLPFVPFNLIIFCSTIIRYCFELIFCWFWLLVYVSSSFSFLPLLNIIALYSIIAFPHYSCYLFWSLFSFALILLLPIILYFIFADICHYLLLLIIYYCSSFFVSCSDGSLCLFYLWSLLFLTIIPSCLLVLLDLFFQC